MNSNIYIHDTDSIHHLKEAIRTFSEEICGNRQLLSFTLQERISSLVVRQKSLYDIQDRIKAELRNAREEYENCLDNPYTDEDDEDEEEEPDCQQEEEQVQELENFLQELQDDIEQTESIISQIQSLAEDIDNKSFSYQNFIIGLAEDTSYRLDKIICQLDNY
ncbi:hypothetical protein [uncultured Parabacteroides sp.]|uniref:hypothetical protein n=1 Tax=uncultured Parabacteroides sp. TaxID=512312 RepID=UPI002604250C|nr:hypothetical protein [uncultured Parabacteroides sp.]